jgi:hypothetical protein
VLVWGGGIFGFHRVGYRLDRYGLGGSCWLFRVRVRVRLSIR